MFYYIFLSWMVHCEISQSLPQWPVNKVIVTRVWRLTPGLYRTIKYHIGHDRAECTTWGTLLKHLPTSWLEEPAILEIVFDDDVGDGIEYELHIVGVGGTGEVGVDFFGFLALVEVLELNLDVLGGFLVTVRSWETWHHKVSVYTLSPQQNGHIFKCIFLLW